MGEMDLLVLAGVLVFAIAAAMAAARGLLGAMFFLMVHPPPRVVLHWRPVVFFGALFWFWYLTPAFAEHEAVTRVLVLLSP